MSDARSMNEAAIDTFVTYFAGPLRLISVDQAGSAGRIEAPTGPSARSQDNPREPGSVV